MSRRREKSIFCIKDRIVWLFHNGIEAVNCGGYDPEG